MSPAVRQGGVGRYGQRLASELRKPITAPCGSLTQLAAPGVNADKLAALLAQTSTSKQDVSLFADMLSLPNDGRYPTLEALATSTLRRSRRAAAKLLTRDGSPAHRRQHREAASAVARVSPIKRGVTKVAARHISRQSTQCPLIPQT